MRTNIKRLNLFICSLMLVLTGLFFVACGEIDYSKVNLTCSQEHITLMLNEEKTINFTIENLQGGMSETLTFSKQGHSVVYSASAPKNGTTAVTITAVEGGQTTIIATSEGQKTCQVVIDVLKPSQTLGNRENTLYVTESKTLTPNIADFKFDADAQLRSLEFYFYGITNSTALGLEHVQNDDGEFVNEFKSVSLKSIKSEDEEGIVTTQSYLLFENSNGELLTFNKNFSGKDDKFISAINSAEELDFSNAKEVYPGDKFTFIAHYTGEENSELYVQRDFYVYTNLDESSIKSELKYKQNSAVPEEYQSSSIVIIPNGSKKGSNIDYGSVMATFSIAAPEGTSDLIKASASFGKDNVANKTAYDKYSDGDMLCFPFEITSATTRSESTVLNVRFYYADLENVNDAGVSYTISIPVEIVYMPEKIVINNGEVTQESEPFVFYDQYYDDETGWKDFNFAISPVDAKYDQVVLKFNPNEVNVRYNGTTYTKDNVTIERGLATIEITDLSLPVKVRGLKEDGNATNGVISNIQVIAYYRTILNDDNDDEINMIEASIPYVVKEGADHIEYSSSSNLNENDILYLSLTEEVPTFDVLVANGEFSSYSIMLESGEDVLEFTEQSQDEKQLIIKFVGKAINQRGVSVYRVTLDNGVYKTFRVQVVEKLVGLNFEMEGEDVSCVKKIDAIEESGSTSVYKRYVNEVYILNENQPTVNFKIFANQNKNSQAISQPSVYALNENGFEYSFQYVSNSEENYISLIVNAKNNGFGHIEISFKSFDVAGFKREEIETHYRMDIVSFSYLKDFAMLDSESKELASYVELFANSPRGDSLTLQSSFDGGFLFYDPKAVEGAEQYRATAFSDTYIYYTSNENVYDANGNGVQDGRMVYGNVYLIGGSEDEDAFARFNTETMTITPLKEGDFEIYAMVMQYALSQPKVFSIHVKVREYITVQSISLQEKTERLNFSANKKDQVKELIVHITPTDANTKEIKVLYDPAGDVNIFGEGDAGIKVETLDKESGIFLVILDASKFDYQKYLEEKEASGNQNGRASLGGKLTIAPTDWLNDSGDVVSDRVVIDDIDINYQTGDKANPYILESAADVLAMKDDLSAYYELATTIDITELSENDNALPLGVFSGHLTGITEDAKITGIVVKKGKLGQYDEKNVYDYGLFSQIVEGAVIKDVSFAGTFDINDQNKGKRMGIVAGLNNGTLENIGVELTADSTILVQDNLTGNGFRLGGVVGGNESEGKIIQGHLSEINENENEDDALVEEKEAKKVISTKTTFFAGNYKIKIDVTNIKSLDSADDNLAHVRVGGLVGRNLGSIIKTKNATQGLGYSNYMSYANIEVINRGDKNIRDYIGGLVGVSLNGNIYSEDKDNPIIVGGRVQGYYSVGGVTGRFNKNDKAEKSLIFKNIISRTFVRGYTNIGAISARTTVTRTGEYADELADSTNDVSFVVQAVEEGKTGLDASMIVNEVSTPINTGNITLDNGNKTAIAFGEGSIVAGVSTVSTVPVYTSFVQRTRSESNVGANYYYGNYVEVVIGEDSETIKAYAEFSKDYASLSVSANEAKGFAKFGDNANLFYMFYFRANSLNLNNDSGSINDIQNDMNAAYNTQASDSDLYPIIASKEIIFSTTSNILSVDFKGTISVTGTGVATIVGSSVLSSETKLTFKIYVTNYFNHSKDISVVYSSMSQSAKPLINGSGVEVKGDNTRTQYIRPNYSLTGTDKDSNATKLYSTQNGIMNIGNVSVNLTPNTSLTADVDNEAEDVFDASCVSQTITLKRKDNLHEDRTFSVKVSPYIMAEGVKAYVNQAITYQVNYQKGAISIKTANYEKASITTGQTLKDTIIINSTAKEDNVKFTIVDSRGRDVLNGNNQLFTASIVDENGKSVMNIQPNNNSNSVATVPVNYAEQKFYLSVSVNTSSAAYQNRFARDIYGTYYMKITAGSDSDVFVEVELKYVNVPLSSITIDNYNTRPTQPGSALSSTSSIAYPGREGVLALTISPDTADFDYLLIENDDQNYFTGNGSASFALITKSTDNQAAPFSNNVISGAITDRGIKLTFDDILKAYSGNNVENYHGVVYLRYIVAANGVQEGGRSSFKITAVKEGENGFTRTFLKQLDLILQNHVYFSLEGKVSTNPSITQPTYDVAKGLKYRINVDSYGFTENEIDIKVDNSSPVEIIKENGFYYLQVLSNFQYGQNEKSKTASITIEGKKEDGTGYASSTMALTIRDYIVNYSNYENANSDIIRGMNNGVISIQIGSKYNLKVDMASFIEFDQSDEVIVGYVKSFMEELEETANWMVHTNLNGTQSLGFSLNENLSNAQDIFDFSSRNSLNTIYFSSQGLSFTPLRTHTVTQNYYVFTFNVKFEEIAGGKYRAVQFDSTSADASEISTRFTFNVYTSSSMEHPIPIDNFDALMNMQEGAHYILMDDIELNPNEFKPINANFKSFDGNGYTITFNGKDSNGIYYDFGSESNIGLFSTINSGTIVKNLTVALTGGMDDTNTNINNRRILSFKTTASSFNAGVIAGQNNGVITNCYVKSLESSGRYTYLVVDAGGATANGYIAGITGSNSGYITNSRSSLYAMTGYYNLSGFVGMNNGKIASSYYKNGILISSASDQNVAGFVLTNSSSGQIITSYVSGENDNKHLLVADRNEDYPNYYIDSEQDQAGFAYSNQGLIENCYTSIRILGSAGRAGFVYNNEGEIKKSFSLSILRNGQSSSAGFAMDSESGNNGTFEDCYYVADSETIDGNLYNYNTVIKPIPFDDIPVKALTIAEFGEYNKYFSNYIYTVKSNLDSSPAVWFMSDGSGISPLSGNFAKGRLELVSANIIAFSQQEQTENQVDAATGDTVYNYVDSKNSFGKGDIQNPIIIYNAQTFENEFGATLRNVNRHNVRIVADIDYQSFADNSQTFRTIYSAVLEGNGMQISNMRLISTERLSSAGLFAQIGLDSTNQATIMNLDLSPRTLSFASSSSVGALSGIAMYSNIYNVSFKTTENLTVIGNNFVGGLIGRTQGVNYIKNISSNASVTANYRPQDDIQYTENSGREETVSYAGSLIGFVGGTKTEITKAYAENVGNILGDRAGYMFGGIGSDAKLEYVYANINPNAKIRATKYGGFVAGETAGKLSYVDVYGDSAEVSIFAIEPGFTPTALGGIAGRSNGGNLSNVIMSQSFTVGVYQTTTSSMTATYVGGLIGRAQTTSLNITKAEVEGNVTTHGRYLGGAIGLTERAVNLSEIAINSDKLEINGQTAYANVGGIIGGVDGLDVITIKNSYCSSTLKVDITNHRVEMSANVGGLIAANVTNAQLSGCYTASTIDIKIEDLSAVGQGNKDNKYEITEIKHDNDSGVYYNYSSVIYNLISNNNSINCNIYGYGTNMATSGGGFEEKPWEWYLSFDFHWKHK